MRRRSNTATDRVAGESNNQGEQVSETHPDYCCTQEFVEHLPAEVGHNLRHRAGTLHITGEDCACGPERVPHATTTEEN